MGLHDKGLGHTIGQDGVGENATKHEGLDGGTCYVCSIDLRIRQCSAACIDKRSEHLPFFGAELLERLLRLFSLELQRSGFLSACVRGRSDKTQQRKDDDCNEQRQHPILRLEISCESDNSRQGSGNAPTEVLFVVNLVCPFVEVHTRAKSPNDWMVNTSGVFVSIVIGDILVGF